MESINWTTIITVAVINGITILILKGVVSGIQKQWNRFQKKQELMRIDILSMSHGLEKSGLNGRYTAARDSKREELLGDAEFINS